MRIIHAQPVAGLKKTICQGDEAVVRQIRSAAHAGLVERCQLVGLGSKQEHKFLITNNRSPRQEFRVGPDSPEYHIMKSLSLALAGTVFPENFVVMRELRLSKKKGALLAAYYSEFVPDESGIIARREKATRRFYEIEDIRERERIRDGLDAEERSLNPRLAPMIAEIGGNGLLMNHPEANYHVSGGRTVFFEIDGIEISSAIEALHRSGNVRGLLLLSQIYSVAVNSWLKNMARSGEADRWQRDNIRSFEEAGFGGRFSFFHHVLRVGDELCHRILTEAHDIVKWDLHAWINVMETTERGECRMDGQGPPVPIEDDVFFLDWNLNP